MVVLASLVDSGNLHSFFEMFVKKQLESLITLNHFAKELKKLYHVENVNINSVLQLLQVKMRNTVYRGAFLRPIFRGIRILLSAVQAQERHPFEGVQILIQRLPSDRCEKNVQTQV